MPIKKNGSKKYVNLVLDEIIHNELKYLAEIDDRSISAVCRVALREYIEKRKKELNNDYGTKK